MLGETPTGSPQAGQRIEQLGIFSHSAFLEVFALNTTLVRKDPADTSRKAGIFLERTWFQSQGDLARDASPIPDQFYNQRSHFSLGLSFLSCKMETRITTSQNVCGDKTR